MELEKWGEPENLEIEADPGLDLEQYPEEFCKMIGVPETTPVYTALDQLMGGFIEVKPENMEKINMFLSFVAAQKPRSFLEAQLIVQMIYCHRLSARMLKKAGKELFPEVADKYLNMGVKLSRVFKNGLETLSKFRRDGKQYFYIEHVNVEKDAQAVIGNVNKGGGA